MPLLSVLDNIKYRLKDVSVKMSIIKITIKVLSSKNKKAYKKLKK